MNILNVFRESIVVAKGNPLIFVPMLAAFVFSALVGLIFTGSAIPMMGRFTGEQFAASPEQALAGAGAAVGAFMMVSMISSFVSFLAHGMTVGMADSALKGQPVTLKSGWERLVARIVPLVIATAVVLAIVTVGMILLVLPGLVAAFFLMFTLVAVMLDSLPAGKALGRSFQTVKKNLGAAFITVLVILGLAFLVMVLNFALVFIPVLGVILSGILFTIYAAFITVFLVRVYHNLDVQTDTSPEMEV